MYSDFSIEILYFAVCVNAKALQAFALWNNCLWSWKLSPFNSWLTNYFNSESKIIPMSEYNLRMFILSLYLIASSIYRYVLPHISFLLANTFVRYHKIYGIHIHVLYILLMIYYTYYLTPIIHE